MYSNGRVCISDGSVDVHKPLHSQNTTPIVFPDPYSRPLVANDPVMPDAVPRSMVTTVTTLPGNNKSRDPHSPAILQTNSFMRPQSASLVLLESVLVQKATTVPDQVACRSDVAPTGSGPSHLRYTTRGPTTQWQKRSGAIPGATTLVTGVSVSNRVTARRPSGHIVSAKGASTVVAVPSSFNGQVTPVSSSPSTVGSFHNAAAKFQETLNEAKGNNSGSSSSSSFSVFVRVPDVSQPGTLHQINHDSSKSSSFNQSTAAGQRVFCDGRSTSLKGARSTNSLVSMATVSSGTVPGNENHMPEAPCKVVQARKPVKINMETVTTLAEKIRITSSETHIHDSDQDYNRNGMRSQFQFKRQSISTAGMPKEHLKPTDVPLNMTNVASKTLNGALGKPANGVTDKPDGTIRRPSSGVITKLNRVSDKLSNGVTENPPIKVITGTPNGVVNKPSTEINDKTDRPATGLTSRPQPLGIGPRNQLINQDKLKKMPVTNTLTGPGFQGKPLTAQELFQRTQPRPLPPPQLQKHDAKRASSDIGKNSMRKQDKSSVDSRSCSSYAGEARDEESFIENDDSELDSLDDENGSDGYESNTFDEYSSDGTEYSIPSLASQSQTRSSSCKIPTNSKAIEARVLPARKTSSRTKSADSRVRTTTVSVPLADSKPLPPLIESLFSNIPPTINFIVEGQRLEPLPSEYKKFLRWRMSSTVPNIVRQCIARSGFKPTSKSYTWLGYWGKHMKPPGFKIIREYQKWNHFPGTFQLGRKDRLWRNLSRMLSRFGKKQFNFFPQTFILPADLATLKVAFEDGGSKHKWIIKPPASACGIGIQVVHKWSEIPKNRSVVVQRYISHPYLINGSKFDLRIYVYITSFDPLRIYIYEDGLARFASVKYSYSLKKLHNRFIHLTNYSVNRRNANYEPNSDDEICQGHKWSLKSLWIYLQRKGVDAGAIWSKIRDLIIKTVISAESIVNSLVKANVRRRYSCHELFGFDILLDEKLKPWIIEVNVSPSLHSNSKLDVNIKGGMIRDLLNLAGFRIPEKHDVHVNPGPPPDSSVYEPSNDVCIDRRLWTNQKSPDEKAKHVYYTQRHDNEQVMATILDVLTPDDIRMLTETVDEQSRCGDFRRVFPSPTSQRYHVFFEQQRYYNLLLQAWCNKYPVTETRGISHLESCCRKGVHLQNPTSDPKHQWVPPFAKEFKHVSPSTNKCNHLS